MNEQDTNRLRDILDRARIAQGMIVGKDRAALDTDVTLALALTRLIEVIGEAASGISMETRDSLSSIPWRNIIGMRNRLIHDYGNVNLAILWKTASEGIPELIAALESALPPTE
jgi:uncharacterized protein with HEPN domain